MSDTQPVISDLTVNPDVTNSKRDVRQVKVDLLHTPPLLGKRIALSSSEGDDLAQLGLSDLHLKDIVIEVNRYLLAAGASLVYGGDLREDGLARIFIELVDRYKFVNQAESGRLHSYLAFPLSLSLSDDQRAKYNKRIKFFKTPLPADLSHIDQHVPLTATGIENIYIWCRSLTNMRELMEKDTDARIFIGGRGVKYKGRAPGVLEELFMSLEQNTPIYLVGSFGGVAAKIAGHLDGKSPLKDMISQVESETAFKELKALYEKNNLGSEMEWPDKLLTHHNLSWDKIAALNGLTVEENKQLATSPHVHEIIFYLLKGLVGLKGNVAKQ